MTGKSRALTLFPYDPHPMIDLGSIAGLHEHDDQIAAYCPCCDAWRVLPLDEWVSQGKGSVHHLRLTVAAASAPIEPTWTINHAWM